jgi:RNA:NAD 2'-phosphotransferase (TPT1/KptA family)
MLYHGTSSKRWESIQADGILRKAPYGDQHVSLTDTIGVARYFAELAADCDECEAVVLSVDAEGLNTEPFVSNAFEECEWERETACLEDIPLSRVSLPA